MARTAVDFMGSKKTQSEEHTIRRMALDGLVIVLKSMLRSTSFGVLGETDQVSDASGKAAAASSPSRSRLRAALPLLACATASAAAASNDAAAAAAAAVDACGLPPGLHASVFTSCCSSSSSFPPAVSAASGNTYRGIASQATE